MNVQKEDRLSEIWDMQAQLDEIIANKHGLVYPHQIVVDSPEAEEYKEGEVNNWLLQMVLCMQAEVIEIQNELQWKHWKDYSKPIDKEKIKVEVIDVIFFGISALQKLEVSAEEAFEIYKVKFEENMNRQNGTSKEGKNYGR